MNRIVSGIAANIEKATAEEGAEWNERCNQAKFVERVFGEWNPAGTVALRHHCQNQFGGSTVPVFADFAAIRLLVSARSVKNCGIGLAERGVGHRGRRIRTRRHHVLTTRKWISYSSKPPTQKHQTREQRVKLTFARKSITAPEMRPIQNSAAGIAPFFM